MPKLSDAIRATRRSGGRRIGFGLPSATAGSATRGLLVVTTDRLDANAAAAILGDDLSDSTAIQKRLSDRADTPLGIEPRNLTPDGIQTAEQAGVDFVVFRPETATADALLSTKLEYVLRIDEDAATTSGEGDLRALASLRPSLVIAPPVSDPLPVTGLLRLRKLGMFIGAPLAVAVEPTASAGLLEALRDSGVAILLVDDPADGAVTTLQATIQSLPERSRRRDDDRDVLVPGITPADDVEDDFDDD
jgi:hypothetical protein